MAECTSKQRKDIIQTISDKQLDVLRELAINMLEKNLPVPEQYKRVLNNRISFIRLLTISGSGEKRKEACLHNIYILKRMCTVAKIYLKEHGV